MGAGIAVSPGTFTTPIPSLLRYQSSIFIDSYVVVPGLFNPPPVTTECTVVVVVVEFECLQEYYQWCVYFDPVISERVLHMFHNNK